MFKRARWMGMGFAAGVGATVWANVKLREQAARYTPSAIGEEAARRARNLGGDLRDALADGRRAMADREAQLRETRLLPAPPAPATPHLRALPGRAGDTPAVPWSDHGYERPSARLS